MRFKGVCSLFLLSALTGCSAAVDQESEPQVVPTSIPVPPKPSVTSLEELEKKYGPDLEVLEQTLSKLETQRAQILSEALKQLAEDQEEYEHFERRVDLITRKIESRERRRAERLERFQALRSNDSRLSEELQASLGELDQDIENLRLRKAVLESEQEDRRASIDERRHLSEQELFERELEPFFREALRLQKSYLEAGAEFARSKLRQSSNREFVVETFEAQLKEQEIALAQEVIEAAGFEARRRAVRGQRILTQAIFSAYVLKAHFPNSESKFGSVSERGKEELEDLVQSFKRKWSRYPDLMIHVDGHADKTGFRGADRCLSATRNYDLSRRRALEVRDFLVEGLGSADKIQADWFGNYANQKAGTEVVDRRFELRIVAVPKDEPSETVDGIDSLEMRNDYVDMRSGLEIHNRVFFREQGRWVEDVCSASSPDRHIEHLSPEYVELWNELGLDPEEEASVDLGESHVLSVRLGSSFVIAKDSSCVAVVPCPDPGQRGG